MSSKKNIIFQVLWNIIWISTLTTAGVQAQVNANFTFSPTHPQVGQTVQFTDTSTGNPTIWQWDFQNPPNGTDSTIQNPTWVFNSPGTYNVRLTTGIPPLDFDEVTRTVVVEDVVGTSQISFTSSTYSVNEGGGSAVVTVRRTGSSSGPAGVRCNTSNGSATAGSDYNSISQTLNWSTGDTSNKVCSINIINDSVDESNETVNLSLSNFSGAMAGSPTSATLTIIDNDDPKDSHGQISFTSTHFTGTESSKVGNVMLRRTGGSDGAVSARCNTSNGTAVAGQDYVNTSTVISWSNGDTGNKSCFIPINDDLIPEDDETINLSLSQLTGGATSGNPNTATLTIPANDNEAQPGQISYTLDNFTVDENAGNAIVTLRRTDGSNGAVSVRCNTSDGTAVAGQDYQKTSALISWADGNTDPKNCAVPITNDAVQESNETINLSLGNFTGGATGGFPTSATLTILDDDDNPPAPAGQISYTLSDFTVDENAGNAIVTLRRTNGSSGAISVRCNTSNGTAVAGQDYQKTSALISWADGNTDLKNCVIPIIDDGVSESDETINLSLGSFTGGATGGSPTSATLTIFDDTQNGRLSFSQAAFTVDEDTGVASISVIRTNGSDGAVSVVCRTSGGTATAGQDYTATSDTLSWGTGQSGSRTCTIPIIDDAEAEASETIGLSLDTFTGGAIAGVPAVATVQIHDNEDPGSLQFVRDAYSDTEDTGQAFVGIERVGGTDGEVGVDCRSVAGGTATEGDDYREVSETLAWNDNEGGIKACTIRVFDDDLIERDETIALALSNPTGFATLGSPRTATLTIRDEDLFRSGFESGEACDWNRVTPVDCGTTLVRFESGAYTIDEDAGVARVEVHRQIRDFAGQVTVLCSTTTGGNASSGSDYEEVSQEITWANQEQGIKYCSIPISDDRIVEGNETLHLQLTLPDGAPAGAELGNDQVVLTIGDVEEGRLSFVEAAYLVTEEDKLVVEIPVQRVGGTDNNIFVTCAVTGASATSGVDYTLGDTMLEWAEGDASDKACTISIHDDSSEEMTESINLALIDRVGNPGLGSQTTTTVGIRPSDIRRISFTARPYRVAENEESFVVTLKREGDPSEAVSIVCETENLDGGATAGNDYTSTSVSVSWADGETTHQTCTIPILDDVELEDDEAVGLKLVAPMGAQLGHPSTEVLTITDVENRGRVTFFKTEHRVNEPVGEVNLRVLRGGGSEGHGSVTCRVTAGTASPGQDYIFEERQLTWQDGQSGPSQPRFCAITVVDDTESGEGTETVELSLVDPTNGLGIGALNGVATLEIKDNDGPALSFKTGSQAVTEGGSAFVVVQRTGRATDPTSVECSIVAGNAEEGDDYSLTRQTLTWESGERHEQACIVATTDDRVSEPLETVILELVNAGEGTAISTQSTTTVTLEDNDASRVAFFADTFEADENAEGGRVEANVLRLGETSGTLSVRCASADLDALAGIDYRTASEVLQWAPGETEAKACGIDLFDDGELEGGERLRLTLSEAVGTSLGDRNSTEMTIVDDEHPGRLTFVQSEILSEDAGPVAIEVRRIGGTRGTVSADCVTVDAAGRITASETLRWVDGDRSMKTCRMPVANEFEATGGDRTFEVQLRNATGDVELGWTEVIVHLDR